VSGFRDGGCCTAHADSSVATAAPSSRMCMSATAIAEPDRPEKLPNSLSVPFSELVCFAHSQLGESSSSTKKNARGHGPDRAFQAPLQRNHHRGPPPQQLTLAASCEVITAFLLGTGVFRPVPVAPHPDPAKGGIGKSARGSAPRWAKSPRPPPLRSADPSAGNRLPGLVAGALTASGRRR